MAQKVDIFCQEFVHNSIIFILKIFCISMQQLGILASILLLTAALMVPVGHSFAQTVDTAKTAKLSFKEMKAQMDQNDVDRRAMMLKKAADTKAMLDAKKNAAGKDYETRIAANPAFSEKDQPTASEILADIHATADKIVKEKKEVIAASARPVQKSIDEVRAAEAQKAKEYKASVNAPVKNITDLKEEKDQRAKTLEKLHAKAQASVEKAASEQQKKAEELRDQMLSQIANQKNRK